MCLVVIIAYAINKTINIRPGAMAWRKKKVPSTTRILANAEANVVTLRVLLLVLSVDIPGKEGVSSTADREGARSRPDPYSFKN